MARVTISSNNLFPGPKGQKGDTGAQGIQGPKGDTGDTGPQGPSGVIAVTSPITNSGSSTSATIGIDQSLIGIAQSQVTNLTSDLANKAGLALANTFTNSPQQINIASASAKGLIVKAASSQTANLQEWQNSAASVLAKIDASGNLFAPTLQSTTASTATLTTNGDTGGLLIKTIADANKGLVIKANSATQSANLFEAQDSSANVITSIIPNSNSGVVMKIGSGAISAANVRTIAQYSGTNSNGTYLEIVTAAAAGQAGFFLGSDSSSTITQIRHNRGTSGLTGANDSLEFLTNSGTVTLAGKFGWWFAPVNATSVPVTIKAIASQTADLQQWQNSAGTVQANVNNVGIFNSNNATGYQIASATFYGTLNGGQTARIQAGGSVGTNPHVVIRQSASQTGDLQQWQDSSANVLAKVDSAGNITANTVNTPVASVTTPITASTYTVGASDTWIVFNTSATHTLTLPTASSFTGRVLRLKTIAAFAINSASSNVKPIDSNTAGTAILAATAGKWATLVSDGTNWVVMQSN